MKIQRDAGLLRSQVVNQLRRMIMHGELKQGEKLVERELCQMLGVSRVLVRESLRQLESEGLIQTIPFRGPYVASVNQQVAEEIFQIRSPLEGLACRGFVASAPDEELVRLKEILDYITELPESTSVYEITDLKMKFFDIIFENCGNNTLRDILTKFLIRIGFIASKTFKDTKRRTEDTNEMRELLQAILDRDAEKAETLRIQHIAAAKKALIAELLKNP